MAHQLTFPMIRGVLEGDIFQTHLSDLGDKVPVEASGTGALLKTYWGVSDGSKPALQARVLKDPEPNSLTFQRSGFVATLIKHLKNFFLNQHL